MQVQYSIRLDNLCIIAMSFCNALVLSAGTDVIYFI